MRVVVKRTIKNIVKMQYRDGTLYVIANIFATHSKIKRIIEENADWIKQKREPPEENVKKYDNRHADTCLDQYDNLNGQQLIKDIFSGRKTILLGDIVHIAPSASSKTYLDGSSLYISEKYFNDRDLRIKAIKSYLKKIAFLFVASEVSAYGSCVSLCPLKIEFKDMGDCWCKCSLAAQKMLCFDYRITQLPQNLRNYIITHAFAHFQYAVHNDAFWNHISNITPHYADLEKQLGYYEFLKDI